MLIRLQPGSTDIQTWQSICLQESAISSISRQRTGIEFAISALNQDRLLYGTKVGYSGSNDPGKFKKQMQETWLDDWNYFTSKDEMTSGKFRGKFTGLQLPKDVVDKIYSRNAIKWYKLDVL